jgi:lipopolysaccharide export system protein LptC
MKKLLFIFLILISCLAYGQTGETKPAGAKVLQTPNNPIFYFLPADTAAYIYMGQYGILKLAGAKQVQHKIDSLAHEADAPIYEIEVSTAGMTTYTLPWKLRSNSLVFYNGNLLPNAKWNGTGTIYFTVSGHVLIKDVIKIKR